MLRVALALALCLWSISPVAAQEARLLRQPSPSATEIAFEYGADIWVVHRTGGTARRITSTPAVESDPHFSPDGQWVAFTSDRAGVPAVYVVSARGGEPLRLTWYPVEATVRGWTTDGRGVLYASSRATAPTGFNRLWTVARTGGPSTLVVNAWGNDGAYSPDGRRMVVDRMTRWDVEWRSYRGGQNTPLRILDLGTLDEVRIPNERSMDIAPVWIGNKVFFISDRDWASNIWSYDVASARLMQVTHFRDAEVKSLGASANQLVFEQDGYLHTLDPTSGESRKLSVTVQGDFPWAETRWEDVTGRIVSSALSPSGKRALMEARGEIFTVPAEQGDTRNLTRSSGVAERAPLWSPDGKEIAWFADSGSGYRLHIASQDGLSPARSLAIGDSKMAWEPAWSPDGTRIAFVDNKVRVQVIEISNGRVTTIDVNGSNIDRGRMGITWSPDSRWIAYAKAYPNMMHRIVAWSLETGRTQALTDAMADVSSPAWDRSGRHLYFLASTNVALGTGWANTSSISADPTYGVYVMVLRADESTPFPVKSDEESVPAPPKPDTSAVVVRVDFEGIDRRILALPMPVRRYGLVLAGPRGTVFVGERLENQPGLTLHKFTLSDSKAEDFTKGVRNVSISNDGKKMLYRQGNTWSVVGTETAPTAGKGALRVSLRMQLDRRAEWAQMFDETWHYERDYFYDPDMHGNDWNAVRARYRPLVAHVRHRADLNYVLDMVNGELSVGQSFVFGGDMPDVDSARVGVLGADLAIENGRGRIGRLYTFESWNPGLAAPLDQPGLRVKTGDYLLGVNGVELTANDDPYRLLDGTRGRQTVLQLNAGPAMDGAWSVTVTPIASEEALRQRAWVEDNRRFVDQRSGGKLAYAWIPNTGGNGTASFDRYVFAQQDRAGAVIDERFNGGGNLDDYMVDHMTRTLRAAITNETPDGSPFRLPQGVLGPKVLLINELAGSGGDYFPWAFRQLKVGPIIGARTWGGLVNSSVHYPLIDGGAVTAPDNAVFDPINGKWVAENEGVPPDVEVLVEAKASAAGRDVQLERAVDEAMKLVNAAGTRAVAAPPFPKSSKRP
ncbi:MAG: PD40 domain-containing protein [Gemmatimonadaceae bacterium]|nr:PD40 domain-containing protein [Gemmatimonadaceae bacterium]